MGHWGMRANWRSPAGWSPDRGWEKWSQRGRRIVCHLTRSSHFICVSRRPAPVIMYFLMSNNYLLYVLYFIILIGYFSSWIDRKSRLLSRLEIAILRSTQHRSFHETAVRTKASWYPRYLYIILISTFVAPKKVTMTVQDAKRTRMFSLKT